MVYIPALIARTLPVPIVVVGVLGISVSVRFPVEQLEAPIELAGELKVDHTQIV